MASHQTGWMEKLPQELINQICDYVTDQRTSKSLRLVSKRFRDRPTINIFRSLILHPEREKWAVLNEIGEVPEIARLVETVVLIRIADILCLRPAEFEEQLIKIGTKTWTESELEAASQTQSSWANAELDFKTWYDVSFRTCPSLNLRDFEPFISLENFINLQNVETVGYCDPKYRTPHPGRADWMEALWELSLGDEDYRDVFEMNPNRCLEMFCLHLERSRKDISSLRVTNIGEILYSPGKGLNLANLSTLTIDLAEEANYSYDESQIYGMHEHTGRFSDWFKSAAPRLRNLTIIQRWITKKRIVWRHFRFGAIIERIEPALDILDLFVTENMTFPMLQTLCLQHVTTTTLSLTKFLNFHRETLVHLKIDRPCIDRDDRKNWNEMRQKIGQEVEQGCFGSESGCETILTDAMTDPLGIDKDWRPFDNYE